MHPLICLNRHPGKILLFFHPSSSYMKVLGVFFAVVKSSQVRLLFRGAAYVSHCGPVSLSLNDRAFILLEQEGADAVWFLTERSRLLAS